jgi:serine/threonine-protein kinase RsbW
MSSVPLSMPPLGLAPERGAPEPWQCATLDIRAAVSSLGTIADYVRSVATRGGVGESAGLRLRLAVEELAANTIVHGYGAARGRLVLSGSGDGRGSVTVLLRDTAAPFNPASRPPAAGLGLPVQDRPVGGLGIHLALCSVDAYAYEHADGENRSSLTVRRRENEG